MLTVGPEQAGDFVACPQRPRRGRRGAGGGGSEETFRLAWHCARPNAVVTVVALYDAPQVLLLPDMYGKNLTFKTGGWTAAAAERFSPSSPRASWTPRPSSPTYPSKTLLRPTICLNTGDHVIKVAIAP